MRYKKNEVAARGVVEKVPSPLQRPRNARDNFDPHPQARLSKKMPVVEEDAAVDLADLDLFESNDAVLGWSTDCPCGEAILVPLKQVVDNSRASKNAADDATHVCKAKCRLCAWTVNVAFDDNDAGAAAFYSKSYGVALALYSDALAANAARGGDADPGRGLRRRHRGL